MVRFRRAALRNANSVLALVDLQVRRGGEYAYIKPYQPFRRTLKAARKAGLPVGDYIDTKFQIPGATQATVDQLAAYGVLGDDLHRVCEVGPGSGRYLERVKHLCAGCSYEIYETDNSWSEWLVRNYQVTAHDADGTTLCHTPTETIDLVHAHKVFVCLPFVVSCGYFEEMVRVVRKGGWIVFDIVSEACMADSNVEKWVASKVYYPCMMAREFVIQFFAKRHCSLRASFFAPMMPGQSEYLIFAKESAM